MRRGAHGDPGCLVSVTCVSLRWPGTQWSGPVSVGRVYCGYVKGGNPAVGVPPRFSSVRVSLAAPCNYCPADKMDSRHGLVFVAAALVAQLLLCLPTPQKPLWFSGFCHPATDSRWYGFVSSLEPFSLLHIDGEGLNLSQENVCVSLPKWTL